MPVWKKEGSSPPATLGREERLQKWWTALDTEQRRHARACVGTGAPDAPFLAGLRDAGIGLADVGWVAHNASGSHIPQALRRFVEQQPED